MSRQDMLLRLYQDLLARREGLGKKLAGELAYLHDSNAMNVTGDSADLAFEAGGDEMSSHLAELDDRELGLIERALARWQQGKYGICAGGGGNCQKKIPVARLNALPYAPFCIDCERAMEKSPGGQARQSAGNWSHIFDAPAPMQDQRINLCDLARGLAGSRHS